MAQPLAVEHGHAQVAPTVSVEAVSFVYSAVVRHVLASLSGVYRRIFSRRAVSGVFANFRAGTNGEPKKWNGPAPSGGPWLASPGGNFV